MKKFNGLTILALLVSVSSAHAGFPGFKAPGLNKGPVFASAPESCWAKLNNNKPGVLDGHFVVTLEVDGLSGSQTLDALEAILATRAAVNDDAALELTTPGAIVVRITPRLQKGESKDQLIERANRELHALIDKTGATVECEDLVHIQGGVSGSN